MDLQRLNEITDLDGAQQDDWWRAIEDLAQDLDDVLVVDQRLKLKDDGDPKSLTIFRCPNRDDGQGTELYALLTQLGQRVVIGRTDALDQRVRSLPLADYDPLWDRIVTVVATRRYRPVGDRLDLWILMRRHRPDSDKAALLVAYHGLVWVDRHGQPWLEPAQDDAKPGAPGYWHAQRFDHNHPCQLHPWHGRDGFAVASGIDALPAWPPDQFATAANGYRLLLLGTDCICVSTSDGLRIADANKPAWRTDTIILRQPASALTLAGQPLTACTCAAGCDDGRIVAFRPGNDPLKPAWSQTFAHLPSTLAFLSEPTAREWPDLLCGFANGHLVRLRHIGEHIRKQWQRCWQELIRGDSSKGTIAWLTEQASRAQTPERHYAIWMRVLERVCRLAHSPDGIEPERRKTWLEEIPKLFPGGEGETRSPGALSALIRTLREAVRAKADQVSGLDAGDGFLPELVLRIYNTRLDVTDRARLDETLRAMPLSDTDAPEHSALHQLRRHAQRTFGLVSSEPAPAPSKHQQLVHRTAVEIERWANAFLSMDNLTVTDVADGEALVGLVGLHAKDGALRAAIARRHGIDVHALDEHRRLQRTPCYQLDYPRDDLDQNTLRDQKTLRQLIRIPGRNYDRLLAIRHSGRAELIDPELGTIIAHRDVTDWGGGRSLAAAAGAAEDNADSALATIIVNRAGGARLYACRIGDAEIEPGQAEPLNLPEIAALDLARDGDIGYRLLIGLKHPGPARVYYLDVAGRIHAKHWLRIHGAGATSVCLVDDCAITGERSGLITCTPLNPRAQPAHPRWIEGIDGAVNALTGFHFDDEPHVLAGAESGELCLLRIRDGQQIWSRRLVDPIRRLVTQIHGDQGYLLALNRGRRVHLFEAVAPDTTRQALRHAQDYLNQIHEALDDSPRAERIKAFRDLFANPKAAEDVLRQTKSIDTRARLLRWIAEYPEVPENPTAIVESLQIRELAMLLSNLRDEAPDWQSAIRDRLLRPPSHPSNKPLGQEHAVTAYLHRLATDKPDIGQVLKELQFVDTHLDRSRMLRLSYVLLLADAAMRDVAATSTDDQLFQQVLGQCLRVPTPNAAAALAELFPWQSALQRGFGDFAELLAALQSMQPFPEEPLRRIVQGLEPEPRPVARQPDPNQNQNQADDNWRTILLPLLRLRLRLIEHQQTPWNQCRTDVLALLSDLAAACRISAEGRNALQLFSKRLRRELPRVPVAADADPLEQRIRCIEDSLRHLKVSQVASVGPAQPADLWRHSINGLLLATRQDITEVLEQEHRYLLQLVRPRLVLERQQRDENDRVSATFSVHAEGLRPRYDVNIALSAAGDQGLRGGHPKLEPPLSHLNYPGRFPVDEVTLDGYVKPGQRQLRVATKLTDAKGLVIAETWTFPLDAPVANRAGPLSLPTALPLHYQALIGELRNTRAPVAVAVLDADLGRDQLIQDWVDQGAQVDLDGAFRDTGVGRRYAHGRIDSDGIDAAIAQVTEEQPGSLPILVGPCDELLARLFEGEAPGVLAAWIARLRERKTGSRPLILLVSSRHANRLRAHGLGHIPELAAHRLTLHPEDGTTSSPIHADLHRELVTLVDEHSRDRHADPEAAVEALGADPRLILRWLRSASGGADGHPQPISDFLADQAQQQQLLDQLRSLPANDLVHVLLGSVAVTDLKRLQVRPGQVAAEDYFSTTRRGRPKCIQPAGRPFSSTSLYQLGADLTPPDRLAVEGFGGTGTTGVPASLLALSRHRGKEQRHVSLQRLSRLGLGRLIDGVFRTKQPYRDLIRGLFHQHSGLSLAKQATAVYAAIAGPGRGLSEVVAPAELAELPTATLQALLPDVADAEIKKLRRLVTLWTHPADSSEIARVLAELFKPARLRRLAPSPESWNQPLLELPLACFGLWEAETDAPKMPGSDDPGADDPDRSGDPDSHVFWLPAACEQPLTTFSNAQRQAEERARDADRTRWQGRPDKDTPPLAAPQHGPRVLLLGPGADALPMDPDRRVAVLRLADVVQAAREGKIDAGLHRKARVQLRLTAYSPFKTSGALPPGSPLFRGRERELEFVLRQIHQASILIVGGRRVGKTSLLNRVLHETGAASDLEPLYVEMQGIGDRKGFLRALRTLPAIRWWHPKTKQALERIDPDADAPTELRGLAEQIRIAGRLPVFLLNEIDRLVNQDEELVEFWRGMNDQGLARFIMVGYSVIGKRSLGDPVSPFFHFTEGTDFGGKAIALAALTEQAAVGILDLLEGDALRLRWADDKQRIAGHRSLLERSHRIPWVLQRYGQLLVERMDALRSDVIRYADVEQLMKEQGDVVWHYIQEIDFSDLGLAGGQRSKIGLDLVLYCLARDRYFIQQPDAPIRDPRLRERNALELGFSVEEAKNIVDETLAGLLIDREYRYFQGWFRELDLYRAFRLLTLTLTLEPDPGETDRYGFLLHILPLELAQRYDTHPSALDDLIVQQGIELLKTAQHKAPIQTMIEEPPDDL